MSRTFRKISVKKEKEKEIFLQTTKIKKRIDSFRRWWRKAQKSTYRTDSKVLKRLKNLRLFEGFPNRAVYEAYIRPKIDEDQSKFTWAMPQIELIRE